MNTSALSQTGSRFATILRSGAFAFTAEITPPLSFVRADLIAKAAPLKALADAVNVTDGAGARASMAPVTAASILLQSGIEPILQLTCRDRNRIALQSDLIAAASLGIANILALRGDDPTAGDQPEAKPVFDLDTRTLLETASALRDRNELPSGRKVAGQAGFFLGAADMPIDPPASWSPDALASKIAAGAQFAQTQFCMDAGVVRRYAARLKEHGLLDRIYLLIGVVPLRSARSARWIRENLFGSIIPDAIVARMDKASDPPEEGKRILIEHLRELAEIPGIAGVHIMAPGHDDAVPEVIAQARGAIGKRAAKP
jgi:methylenetetrahydrofolate reductase (NADPH)